MSVEYTMPIVKVVKTSRVSSRVHVKWSGSVSPEGTQMTGSLRHVEADVFAAQLRGMLTDAMLAGRAEGFHNGVRDANGDDEACAYCGAPDPTGFQCCQSCADRLAVEREAESAWQPTHRSVVDGSTVRFVRWVGPAKRWHVELENENGDKLVLTHDEFSTEWEALS